MKTKNIILGIFAVSILAVSCKKEGCTDPTASNYDEDAKKDDESCEYPTPTYDTKIMFMPKFGTADFEYNTTFTDGSGNAVQFSRLNFYITSPQILGHDDVSIHSAPNEAFLFTMDNKSFDLGNIETTMTHFHELKFNVGVPENLNTENGGDAKDPSEYANGHPLGFQTPNMHWSWNSGYIFIAVEGMVDVNGDQQLDSLVEYHIGMNSNLTPIELVAHNDVSGSSHEFHVKVDIEKLFNNVDMSSERVTHTMDNMMLANKIMGNLTEVFSVEGH